MENNDFEKIRIKNRTCHYFDDSIKLEDFEIDNIYDFDLDGFITISEGTRYNLALFGPEE